MEKHNVSLLVLYTKTLLLRPPLWHYYLLIDVITQSCNVLFAASRIRFVCWARLTLGKPLSCNHKLMV